MQFELDWLKKWNQLSPRAIAIQDGDSGRQISYSQMFRFAQVGASWLLKKYQIAPGDRVAVLAQNELETVFLYFALHRLGATIVPINFRLTTREVQHIVSDCEPKLLFSTDEFSPITKNLSGGFKVLDLLSETGFAGALQSENDLCEGFLSEPESIAMIIYTSGTTGAPKGAMLSHRMIFWNSINTSMRLNISQSDCTVIFLPFFHTGGWNVLTTPFLHRGAKVIFLKKFDGEQILRLSESEKATLLFGVPTTMDMMARSSSFPQIDLSSLRYAIVGGEPMPIELIQTWSQKGIPIRQGYGLTEFGPNVFSLNEEDSLRKIGSIGFPNFYVDVQILDQNGQAVEDNEVGELVLKGPSMMSGYWKNPSATEETIKNDWLYTGDLVQRDPDGYFYVVGRKKEMFKSGGENVYPAELEKVIRAFPGVREVAVIGVPDSKWGEVGKAFIVKEPSARWNEPELVDYCQSQLAKFKVPKHFQYLSELPKGDSGKILKRLLSF